MTWRVGAASGYYVIYDPWVVWLGRLVNSNSGTFWQVHSHTTPWSEDTLLAKRVVLSVTYLERQYLHELVKRAAFLLFRPLKERHSKEVADRLHLLEPLFIDQWHLVNDEHSEHMTNTTPVVFWVSAAKMSWSPITSSDGLYFGWFERCTFSDPELCSRMPRILTTSTTTSSSWRSRSSWN